MPEMCSCIETVITDLFGSPCNVFGAQAVSLLVKVQLNVQKNASNKRPVWHSKNGEDPGHIRNDS